MFSVPYLPILFNIILCYLLGSIPTAVWVGRLFFNIDVRSQGSGNAGATNTFRVLGKGPGIFVLLFDVAKGFAGTFLAQNLYHSGIIEINDVLFLKLVFGMATVLGHIYPIFAGFKGGKGVATLLGMVFSIYWLAGLICLGVFLVLFLIFHFVSVGSMAGAVTFAILLLSGFCGPAHPTAVSMALFLATMVIYTHRSNLKKLNAGTENKMYLFKSKR